MRWMLIGLTALILSGCNCQGAKLTPILPCESYPEICNGRDDDCDGVVDNGTDESCSTACGFGFRLCQAGELTSCNAKRPVPETCDQIDNDCDGVVDNPEKMPVEFCYNGPSSELTYINSQCRPGIRRCEFGRFTCQGQVTPKPEVCNGLDDDCNGSVDNGTDPIELDIVVVIDNSCSMYGVISTVQTVVTGFQQKYSNRADLRWALVAAPDKDYNSFGWHPTLQVDFTDPANFSTALNKQAATGSGQEATVDALDMLISQPNELKLSWKPTAKKVVVIFSDEEPQSYGTTETYGTIGVKIANMPFLPLAEVRVFTDTSQYWMYVMWHQIVPVAHVYNIKALAADMRVNLDKIIVESSCKP